jgi:hypothetical protein
MTNLHGILDDIGNALGLSLGELGTNEELLQAAKSLLQGDYVGATVSRIAFVSNYTEPAIYTAEQIRASSQPNAPAPEAVNDQGAPVQKSTWGSLIKPTIIIESPLRKDPYVYAPYGEADPGAYKSNQLLLKWGPFLAIALVGGGFFFLGRATKR